MMQVNWGKNYLIKLIYKAILVHNVQCIGNKTARAKLIWQFTADLMSI